MVLYANIKTEIVEDLVNYHYTNVLSTFRYQFETYAIIFTV